jgi:hypothetical protein
MAVLYGDLLIVLAGLILSKPRERTHYPARTKHFNDWVEDGEEPGHRTSICGNIRSDQHSQATPAYYPQIDAVDLRIQFVQTPVFECRRWMQALNIA